MKKLKRETIIYYTLSIICFILVCICHFVGFYSRIVSGVMMIAWTLNGFLLGVNYQNNKDNDVITMQKSLIELQDTIITNLNEDIDFLKKNEE